MAAPYAQIDLPAVFQAAANYRLMQAQNQRLQQQMETQQREDAQKQRQQELLREAMRQYAAGNPQLLQQVSPQTLNDLQLKQADLAVKKSEAAKNTAAAGKDVWENYRQQQFNTGRALYNSMLAYQKNPQALPQINAQLRGMQQAGVIDPNIPINDQAQSVTPEQMAQGMAQAKQMMSTFGDQKFTDLARDVANSMGISDPYQAMNDPATAQAFQQRMAAWAKEKYTKKDSYGGMLPMMPQQGGPQGDAYLSSLPPDRQAVTRAIIEGRQQMPTGRALMTPVGQQMMRDVAMTEPGFDLSQWKVRNEVRTDFTKGKAAQNIRSLNTLVHHLGNTMDSAAALANSSNTMWNFVANKAAETTGDPRITRFRADVTAATNEAASLFKNTGATDQEIEAMRRTIPENGSLAQQMSALKEIMTLALGRMAALQDQWDNAFRGVAQFKFLTPKALNVMRDKLGMDVSGMAPTSGAPAAPVPPQGAAPPQGSLQAPPDPRSMTTEQIQQELRQLQGGQ